MPPRDASVKVERSDFKEPLQQTYPCKECKSTIPYCYCTPCRAEFEKRRKVERDDANATQRKQYAIRKERREWRTPPSICPACNGEFLGKRKDSKFCSNRCKQRSHRAKLTPSNRLPTEKTPFQPPSNRLPTDGRSPSNRLPTAPKKRCVAPPITP
jgi:hypothetical protein